MTVIPRRYNPVPRTASAYDSDVVGPDDDSSNMGNGRVTVVSPFDSTIEVFVADPQMMAKPAAAPRDSTAIPRPGRISIMRHLLCIDVRMMAMMIVVVTMVVVMIFR
jgi:hypothetical protein